MKSLFTITPIYGEYFASISLWDITDQASIAAYRIINSCSQINTGCRLFTRLGIAISMHITGGMT